MQKTGIIEVFVQKDDRFGIKFEGSDDWINGFDECPQKLEKGVEATVPYHEVVRNGKKYVNYGDQKPSTFKMIRDLNEQVSNMNTKLMEIHEILKAKSD